MTNDLSKKILDTIEEKHITPKPRWEFLVRESLVWLLGGLSIGVGALATSVICYMWHCSSWQMHKAADNDFLAFLVIALPHVWIMILIVFIGITYYNIRHTKKGYRYGVISITIGSIAISMMLGGLLYAMGVGEITDELIEERAPKYHKVLNPQKAFWVNPEEGRIAGKVVEINGEYMVMVKDPRGKVWVVDTSDAKNITKFKVKLYRPIRVKGMLVGTSTVKAQVIFPIKQRRRAHPPKHHRNGERKSPRSRTTE